MLFPKYKDRDYTKILQEMSETYYVLRVSKQLLKGTVDWTFGFVGMILYMCGFKMRRDWLRKKKYTVCFL